MNLIEKYLGEAKFPKMKGWEFADNLTKEIMYDAVYMRRYHGYDLTILNKDGKWIPVHGSVEMKPAKNANDAAAVLIKYVDKLPEKSKISGDNKIRRKK